MPAGIDFTDEELALAASIDPEVAAWLDNRAPEQDPRKITRGFYNFQPRPDNPAEYDQQESFCNASDYVSFLIGGNAAGTTEAATYKAAQFLLRKQPPPRKDTPFWILANTYEQVGDVIWKEKLLGHGHLPRCEVDWRRISWRDQKKGHPEVVPLLPWADGDPDKNWTIHFKSYGQGREAMQASSIGGFFFSEQFPHEIYTEVLRGCREYNFPGGQFCEFTPIDPELCVWVEEMMEAAPPGVGFYRANTAKNRSLADGWLDMFKNTVSDEMLATRLTGQLATFEGMIYQSWHSPVHVLDYEFGPPPGARCSLATDWGASEEHPHVSVFGAEDNGGTWWVFDEYFSVDQMKTLENHAEATIAICERWGWKGQDWRTKDKIVKRRIVPDALHSANYADPSRPGNLTEYTQRGLPTLSARNAVIEGINYVRSLLKINSNTGKPRIFVSPRCQRLISEFRRYRWRRGNKTIPGIRNPTVAVPEPLKKDDDALDALRYMLYSRAIHGRGETPNRAAMPKSTRPGIMPHSDAAQFGIQFHK